MSVASSTKGRTDLTRFVPDTNVLIAALDRSHVHHQAARSSISRRLEAGETMLLVGHSLVECYSVLTRLPAASRIALRDAVRVIQSSFIDHGSVVALPPAAYVAALMGAASRGIGGGRIYDLLIAETARLAGADVLLTFNLRHFAAITEGLDVKAPESS